MILTKFCNQYLIPRYHLNLYQVIMALPIGRLRVQSPLLDPTKFKISTCIICSDLDIGQVRLYFSHIMRGVTKREGIGQISCLRRNVTNIVYPLSKNGLESSCIVFSRLASLNDRLCQMLPRWDRVAHFLRAVTGELPVIRKLPSG